MAPLSGISKNRFSKLAFEALKAKKKIGVQAYSVRDALKADFSGSMKKIGDMGYSYIEAYDLTLDGKLFGMAPAEYKKIVEDNGIELISSHCSYFNKEQAPKVVEASQEAGLKYLIVPWLNDEYRSDYLKVSNTLNEVGEQFKDAGIKFGYHNHAFEFEKVGDKYALEVMLENTDPELVTFELDLYWVVNAGADPVAMINKYPGRFSMYHVKDANKALEQTTVGSGIIDFQALLAAKEKAGMEYYFVEDERTETPFENIQSAIEYLNKMKV
jgi:sugar phosphate isomerase/epimerase